MAGYGECVAMEHPFYNHETIDTAWLMTTKYIVPLLEAARIQSAAQVRHALAPIRENRMAKAAVEAAIWDLEAKLAEQPLWRHIGGTQAEITCGVSIGLAGFDRGAPRQGQPGNRRAAISGSSSRSNLGRTPARRSRPPRSFRTSRSRSTPILPTRSCPTLRSSRDWTTSAC